MNPKIEDLTVEVREVRTLKPIELISCLQSFPNSSQQYYFYNPQTERFKDYSDDCALIQRIARNLTEKKYDLILCDNRNLFLGYWNDGVV